MSEAEYECLIAGGRLMNATDHHRERGQKTDSVGFCFFPEDPDEAIHWLAGCTYPDCCVTLDIPDGLLRESYGTYRDPSRDDLTQPAPPGGRPTMRKREYCLTSYSLSDGVRVISMTDKYADYAQIRRDFVKMGLMQP
jgi:hypothetical protein